MPEEDEQVVGRKEKSQRRTYPQTAAVENRSCRVCRANGTKGLNRQLLEYPRRVWYGIAAAVAHVEPLEIDATPVIDSD